MSVLSGRIKFVSFSTTWIFCYPKIPMKYSKNGQKFAMSKNTSNMLFRTCWTLCKKPHLSTWSRSRYTFFWMTRYQGRRSFLTSKEHRNKMIKRWELFRSPDPFYSFKIMENILPPIPVQWWSGNEVGAYHSISQTPMHLCKKNFRKAIAMKVTVLSLIYTPGRHSN